MGAKYEVRWAINNACPIPFSKWTNSLIVAIAAFIVAVIKGNTSVKLVVHEWIDCPSTCEDFEYCPQKVD